MENEIKIENEFIGQQAEKTSNSFLPKENLDNKGKISDFLNMDKYTSNESIVRNIPFVLFVAGLMIFYIWNSHQTEKMIRDKNKIGKELNELRWEYMTSKNDLMFKSKQTEVMKLLQDSTLRVLTSPPKKIVVEKNKY